MLSKRFLLLATVLLTLVHLMGTFLRDVPFYCVLICPLFIMFIQLIMHVSFSNSIKTGDFSMIAGYKKTDSVKKTVSVLISVELYCGIVAIMCEALFFSIYFVEDKKIVSFVLPFIYIIFLAIIVLVSNHKYSEI